MRELADVRASLARGSWRPCAPLPELGRASLADQAKDDAAILPIGNELALVSSIDFQNPIVDDAVVAGEIAAKNALSDIFACGLRPMYADVVLVLPYGDHAVAIGQDLMRGISRACREDNCTIVGGHTILGEAPIVGLSVFSISPLDVVKRKSGARVGDVLLLTKPLGSGIAIAAHQQGVLTSEDYAVALETLRQSNRVGARLGSLSPVSAMTDITGFGLLGRMTEVAEGSGVKLRLRSGKVPLLPGITGAAREGAVPNLGEKNLHAYQDKVRFVSDVTEHRRLILSDPQTNGGLLVAVRSTALEQVQAIMMEHSISAHMIGDVVQHAANDAWVEVVE
ncbi:selenide, water dikinase SelD [Bradyrhizobium sp. HKCCYLS20291]|uniref:selenide, water dikinase SelD n=1 Tax=Bradyrhizobium sp. HKCCYLS20291 TaxID=3420766 RepID=UPI003EB7D5F2